MGFLQDNLGIIITGFTGFITSVFAFFKGRKQLQSDNKKSEAGALESTQSVYDTLTRHMEKSLNDMKEEIKDVKTENVEQRKEMRKLQADNRNLHIEISNMMKENNELKDMVRKLSSENEKLYAELSKYRKK